MPEQYTINGTITSGDGAERLGFKVQAFDRDLPSLERRTGSAPQLLGEAIADAEGRFQITYTLEQFQGREGLSTNRRSREKHADISFRVFDQAGQELSISNIVALDRKFDPDPIIFNAPAELEVNIYVGSRKGTGISEYEELIALISPVIEDLPLAALSDDDIVFLLREFEIEQESEQGQRVEWLRRSAMLARETSLPIETFYGWGRKNVPATLADLVGIPLTKLPLMLKQLLALEEDDLSRALMAAMAENIIPASLHDRMDDIIRQLKRRDQVSQEIVATLIDAETGDALTGYTVATFDVTGGREHTGQDITDNNGRFSFRVYVPQDLPQDAPARRVVFHITTPEGVQIPESEPEAISLNQPETQVVLVRVKLPKPQAPSLKILQQEGQLKIPAQLFTHLKDQGIRTFADIRRRGGLSQMASLPKGDPEAIRKLESLADLDRISPDVQVNQALIERGFENVSDIANSDRFKFVNKAHDLLGDFKAANLYVKARTQTWFLNNQAMSALADRANGFTPAEQLKELNDAHPQKCGCDDCEAAVSPLAYLIDLIRYTTEHVDNNGVMIGLNFLVETFHQPFRDLPTSCEASEKQVRQVRLCIEVLRDFLRGNRPLPVRQTVLDEQERLYRINAYTSLLNKVGTSFEEIRLAKSASKEDRNALAERIGIELTPLLPPLDDELGQLLLDTEVDAREKRAISEQKLEELFGLADTGRDPLSESAKLGDIKGQIKRWNLDNAIWGKNTDSNGSVFLSLAHDLAANIYRVQVFQDKKRTKLIATAESNKSEDTVSLVPQNNSELFGSIQFTYTEATADIEIVAIPRLLSWRLRRLRSLWQQQDRPTDPYSANLLPVIDPDLVGPDDFRPTVPGQPKTVLTLWQTRRAEVDALFAATKAARESNIADADGGVDALLTNALGKTLADLKAIRNDLDQGDDAEKRRAAQAAVTTTLHLTTEAFTQLDTLLTSAASLKPAQWEEVYAILTQARKVAKFPAWITEEQGDGIILGMRDFWVALNEPKSLPKWRATTEGRQVWQQALRQRSKPPIIDPDLTPATSLADPLIGPARTHWKKRYDAITQLMKGYNDKLKAVRQASENELAYFDSIIEKAIGASANRLLSLDTKRRKGETIEKELAQLTLSSAALNYLLRFRVLLEKGEQVLDAEWNSIFSILVQVWKERHYSIWRDAEEQDGTTLSQDYFQLPVPPKTILELQQLEPLPEWRATWLARRDWEDKLRSRIDAERSIFAGVSDVVDTTEEATLIGLRNALIQAAAAPGVSPGETAKSLADRLLIDTEVGSCQKTTRVAQAIETLQLLLFRLRSGQLPRRRDWTVLNNSQLVRADSPLLSAPLTSSDSTDHTLVLVGNDNRIYSIFASIMFDGSWSHVGEADNHSIPANAIPSLFSLENKEKAWLFAMGDDGHLFFTLLNGRNDWAPWSQVGDLEVRTDVRISVAAAVMEEVIHVFVVRDDGQIYGNWWDDRWHDWTRIGNEEFRVPTNAVLGVASLKRDAHLFVAGNDGKIHTSQVIRNTSTDWAVIGAAGDVSFSPGASVSAKGIGYGDAFVELVAVAKDGGIYRTSWNEMMGDWTAWAREGTITVSADTVVTMAGRIGYLQLFVVGKNGEVFWKTAQDWEQIGDTAVKPGAVVTARFEPTGPQHLYITKGDTVLTTSRATVGEAWNLSVLALKLQAPKFDEEWKWIGSYATWRAAMFVFLYPENLLLPNLKEYKTPAFETLIEKLRSNRRLTPEDACAAAREYAEYVKDVCSLTVEATCQTKTKIHKQGTCQTDTTEEKYLMYLFGRTPSGKVYWSVFDPSEKSGHAQKSWRVWPFGDIALTICGAAPYTIDDARRFIYLFFVSKADNPLDTKIRFARVDLNRQDWEAPPTELPDPPVDKYGFKVVVHQGVTEKFPPLLAMWPSTVPLKWGGVIQRSLNRNGDGWRPPYSTTESEWEQFMWEWGQEGNITWSRPDFFKDKLPIKNLHAVLTNDGDPESYNKSTGDQFVTAKNDLIYRWYENPLLGNEWLGMYVIGSATNSFDKITSLSFLRIGNPFCARSEYGAPDYGKGITLHQTLSNLIRVIPNWGSAPAAEARVTYMRKTDLATETCCCPLSQAPDGISGRRPTLVLPALPNNEPIQVSMPGQDRTQQRLRQQQVYQANNLASQSILALLEEAYYLVPMYIASRLQAAGQYTAALDWYRTVYDHGAPQGQQKIYHGLTQEETLSSLYQRQDEWLLDPLNPHAIAKTRRNTYTRFTLISIARCMLEFADTEFTRDTAESLPRARELYLAAQELLTSNELQQQLDSCGDVIGQLKVPFGGPLGAAALSYTKQKLGVFPNRRLLSNVASGINAGVLRTGGEAPGVKRALTLLTEARVKSNLVPTLDTSLSGQASLTTRQQSILLKDQTISQAMERRGQVAGLEFQDSVSVSTGISPDILDQLTTDLPWLRFPGLANGLDDYIDNLDNLQTLPAWNYPSLTFCLPPNPILRSLKLRAEMNLRKIRTCRNIAGIQRQIDPYAAPTDTSSGLPVMCADGRIVLPGASTIRPTLYRYSVLIERAKQLCQIAGQMEAAMLTTLEKSEQEAYNLLKAKQDLGLAQANVRLQGIRLMESDHGIKLAEQQQARAQISVNYYDRLIEEGLLAAEQQALELLSEAAAAYAEASGYSIASAAANGVSSMAALSVLNYAGAYGSVAAGLSSLSSAYSSIGAKQQTRASLLQAEASFERRQQEWKYQLALGQKDTEIGQQQVLLANDRKQIVEQEKIIAELQTSNAKDTIEFLNSKFGNKDLYDWMSEILEDTYGFFLQQATTLSRLAENQLAFERQEPSSAFIRNDYWSAPREGLSADAKNPDRRGLTGSARLLRDIFELDQYAFDTNKRKLQFGKTISLAMMAPSEFQRFRETGVMIFSSPMELFDRDFPGHYLRLIRKVRTSVIALIPPVQGIHATLTATGLSRVVIGPDIFQTIPIRRDPEFVALTSPASSTGLFEMEPQQTEMLLPFEGNGVDSTWEFRMPKAANQFDYRTIADVLITIEYTALNSFDYRQQVTQTLNPSLSGDRPFSFRNQFADQWYDLHNPDQTKTPMQVRFKTVREDFPPNIENLRIEQVLLYFVRASEKTIEFPITQMSFTEYGNLGTVGGRAIPINGVISTRRGNGGSWRSIIGKSPVGEWELALPNTPEVKKLFTDEEIEEILVVITYSARTPEWPA